MAVYHLQHKEHTDGQKPRRTQRNQKETRQNHEGKAGRKKRQKITPDISSQKINPPRVDEAVHFTPRQRSQDFLLQRPLI